MFITDTIPGYHEDLHTDRENDWICVEDLCSSYCEALNGDSLNVCAWWNKRTKLIYFGGQWTKDCPPVYSEKEPTDTQIWEFTKNSWVNKRMAAYWRQKEKRDKEWKEADKIAAKDGVNFIYVILEKDGIETKIKQPIRQKNILQALQLVGGNIMDKNNKFFGNKIKFLKIRNWPESYLNDWHNGKNKNWDFDTKAKEKEVD